MAEEGKGRVAARYHCGTTNVEAIYLRSRRSSTLYSLHSRIVRQLYMYAHNTIASNLNQHFTTNISLINVSAHFEISANQRQSIALAFYAFYAFYAKAKDAARLPRIVNSNAISFCNFFIYKINDILFRRFLDRIVYSFSRNTIYLSYSLQATV